MKPEQKRIIAAIVLFFGLVFCALILIGSLIEISSMIGLFLFGMAAFITAAFTYIGIDYIRLLNKQIQLDKELQVEEMRMRVKNEINEVRQKRQQRANDINNQDEDLDEYEDIADLLTRRAPSQNQQGRQ